MDNASKALIMAGAILIAVALVGVGVYLYSSAASQVDNAGQQLSAAEIQLKNSEFEQYEGTKVRGTEVAQLVRKVNAFNAQDVFPKDITFTVSGGSLDADDLVSGDTIGGGIKNTKSYTVGCNYDGNGYIYEISITENP